MRLIALASLVLVGLGVVGCSGGTDPDIAKQPDATVQQAAPNAGATAPSPQTAAPATSQ